MVNSPLIARDLKHVWHPCSQMKDFETLPPLLVHQAKGSYLFTEQGPLIDANSSWWCKSLGHGHPAVLEAIQQQLSKFEHVIAANTTHPALVELAEHLAELSQLQHVFFASDGSCAVEIALKLAIHANLLQGKAEKNQFLALTNGYHGETLATLSISDLGIYKAAYQEFQLDCNFLDKPPYVSCPKDPLWSDCSSVWPNYEKQLEALRDRLCAIVFEPLVQGAGGMLIYSADFLQRLSTWAKKNDILLIADEIMTGCGRTGSWLACQQAGVQPDLICLSKGLTSGTIPFSCVLIDDPLYQLFYDDYETGKAFLHSHTYSGNALGVVAALATLKTMKNEDILSQVRQLSKQMFELFDELATSCGQISNIRHIGAIIAADLEPAKHPRIGYKVYAEALKRGAFLRPLGNTLYWLPPLNTDENTIRKLAEITLNSINAAYKE